MVNSSAYRLSDSVLQRSCEFPPILSLLKPALLLVFWLLMIGLVRAEGSDTALPAEIPLEISGSTDSTVFGMGHSIRITGTVKQGAMALGGDVIVEGTVEGDVAAVGGSVIQGVGARIGGDVIVLGGTYKHLDSQPNRNPASMTMMYAGYEDGLRKIMRNPSDILRPHLSSGYLGLRLLAVLFWFVVSLGLTAAMPATISRGMARLQLSTLRVTVIGVAGLVVLAVAVPLCLLFLPGPVGTVVGLMALTLFVIAGVIGRVMIYGATGRWLQRKYIPLGKNSESAALLIGTVVWITLSSLPYIWPIIVALLVITSLGLALTARYPVGRNRSRNA